MPVSEKERTEEYFEEINVDEHALDFELKRQSQLIMKYVKLQVTALTEKDRAKEKLEQVAAELDIKIRKDPSAYGLDKVTETAIKNVIILSDEYKKQTEEYLDCKEDEGTFSGVLKALDHKKKSLEKLSDLWVAGYYSSPVIKKEIEQQANKEKVLAHKEQINQRLRKRRNIND